MRAILFGWIVFACALPGLALGFTTEASLGWGPVDPADLNLFIGAANGALEFFRQDLGAQGDIPSLEPMDDAIGLRVGESWALGITLGLEVAVFKAETNTSGIFTLGDQDYPVSLSLSLRNMRFGLLFCLPLLDQALSLGISGGIARAIVDYAGDFAYPEEEWAFAYVPPSFELQAVASSFYGTAFTRAAFGLFPGLRMYLELRGHWQPEAPLLSREGEVDLNGDGDPDRVGFVGFWLAGGIQIEFPF